MSDLLDLPPIETAALALPESAPVQALDLRKIDLTDVALAQYGDWRKDVAATKTNLSTLALDLSTAAKVKEARTLRHRLIGEPLAAVRKVAAGIKSAMATTSKAVGAELEKIEAAYSEADALILPKIEAREAELEAERAEKARIEAERVATLTAKVATIRGYVQRAAGASAEKIEQGIKAIEAWTFLTETWQEFAGQAEAARTETLEALRRMHAAAVQAEADRAERERLEADAARLRAEVAEQKRIQAERQAAELAAIRESERLEALHRASVEAARLAEVTAAAAQMAARIVGQTTVTTPDGTVADASTGEILDPIRPDEPDAAPAPTLEDMSGEKPDVQDSVGVAEVNPAPPSLAPGASDAPAEFGRSSINTPEYRAEQEALNARARAMLEAAADAPAVKLGDLNARLGFTMTEACVRSLGITPAESKGRAVLIPEAQLSRLACALIDRITEVLG